MIARADPAPLATWRGQIDATRRRYCPSRPLAALGCLTHGPAIEGLIEIEQLVFVVLHDDHDARNRAVLRLAGFSGTRVPWGVRWGGPDQSRFDKDLLLPPRPGARGLRLDTSHEDLLRLALQLDRDVDRHLRYAQRCKRQRVRLPHLWAGFRLAEAATLTGDGPELAAYCQRMGQSPELALRAFRRAYFGLVLYPFEWVSHHWQQAVTVLADLRRFPQRQVFPLRSPNEALVGCQGVVEYNFLDSRFRKRANPPVSDATAALALA